MNPKFALGLAPGSSEFRIRRTSLFIKNPLLYNAGTVFGFLKLFRKQNKPSVAVFAGDGIERNLAMAKTISVVVPVMNEVGNVDMLVREIAAAISGEAGAEIIFVDDSSTDGTPEALIALKGEFPQLRVIRHGANAGQSRAIRIGVQAAHAPLIVTLDGDGQNDPADIPKLLAILRGDERIGMVSGVRAKRQDTVSKKLASRIGNGIRQWLLKDGATDTGCGIKAFRREAFLSLPYFDHIHRFLIALMLREGYEVRFVDVNHRPRHTGQSKYTNFGRMLVGITDLMGVRWLQRRFRRPADVKEI
jgi:dolichol-phosphate mannosyltransferase